MAAADGGTARHDAVAWGYARGADKRGVDIIQNCEVIGIRRDGGRVTGVDTTRGFIGARKIGVVAAGHCSVLAAMVGIRLPIESHPLQALVSEPIKPVLDTVVISNAVHGYISQADKGDLVIGAGISPAWLAQGEVSLGPTLTPYGPLGVRFTGEQAGVHVRLDPAWRHAAPCLEFQVPGCIPLVRPAGGTDTERLTAARQRLGNDEVTERAIVRDQLARIVALRLAKLLDAA